MNRIKWNPFQELVPLSNGLEDIKKMDFIYPGRHSAKVEEAEEIVAPAIEMTENSRAYVLQFHLEHLSKAELHVLVENRTLNISADRKKNFYNFSDHHFDGEDANKKQLLFQETLQLPASVDDQHIEASFVDGLLTVIMPKNKFDEGTNELDIQ